MKSYTDLEQSRKLAKFLPIESANMFYWCADHYPKEDWIIEVGTLDDNYECICAWSLAALLDVLNKTAYFMDEDASVNLSSYKTIEWDLGIDNSDLELVTESNPVDACVEMIIKLHELNLL